MELEHHADLAAQPRRAGCARPVEPRGRSTVDRDSPASNGSSPATARRMVVLPEPGEPHQRDAARRARPPGRRRAGSRARRASAASPRTSSTGAVMASAPSTALRAAAPGARAAATSPDTAPRTARRGSTQLPMLAAKICVCFVSSTTVMHRDQRRVLEQRDEVVGHRREREAERLRPAHQRSDLPVAEAERPRRLELPARHRLERAR